MMKRREFLLSGLGCVLGTSWLRALQRSDFDGACAALVSAIEAGQVHSGVVWVRRGETTFSYAGGKADSDDAVFLLASISKPISVAAFMTLYDAGEVELTDPVSKFIPEFRGNGRESILVRQLLTHVSGLPDQLPENATLRARHAPLSEFVERAIRTPLQFVPGSRYGYSSMAILLVSEIARRITRKSFAELVDETVYRPLGMRHSAMGVGHLDWRAAQRCQVEQAAPESGAGDPTTRDWDWNSSYWRHLGAPWGGAHGSAPDVGRFLHEFLHPSGSIVKAETARLMIRNHNRTGLRSRGLGFDVGARLGPENRDNTFGHTASTGTLCWADPQSHTTCDVLTTLPARAVSPHPRDLVSQAVARSVG